MPTISPLIADITHILDIHQLSTPYSSGTQGHLRNSDTSLARLTTVQLDPRVVHGMVSDGEAIDSRPEPPSRPLADMRMSLSGYDQCDEVADVSSDDGSTSTVRSVA